MSFDADMIALLNPLFGGNVFFDATPEGFAVDGDEDFCILQIVGGRAGWYTDQEMPSHKHARMQVECYSKRATQRSALARSVEGLIAASSFVAEPYGAFVTDHRTDLARYISRQDFGVWYPDP